MAFSLKAILGLETTKFERGLDKARSKLSSSVGSMMKRLAPLAGFIGFTAIVNNALSAAKEIDNLSKVANSSVRDFQRNAFAAKTVGVEQQKLADIYKDAGDKIGDFLQTGAGPLADFFEKIAPKVGVTADMFRDLSGPDALQLYYDSIEKANLSQAEMTFFMEAIASDATLLIPLLKEGGDAMKNLGDAAESMPGGIFSEKEIEDLKRANEQIESMQRMLTIIAGKTISNVRSIIVQGGLNDDEFKAKLQLQSEGKLNNTRGRGGVDRARKLIQERAELLKQQREAERIAAEKRETELSNEINQRNELNRLIERRNELELEAKKDQPKVDADMSKQGMDIDRMEGESRSDFIRRRAKARESYFELDKQERSYMAGVGDRPSEALRQAASGNLEPLESMTEQQKQTNSELKSIKDDIARMANEITAKGKS